MSRKLIVAVVAFAVSVAAQQPSPDVRKAFGMLQSGDAAGAVRILEDLTQREPKNVLALRVLGASYIRTKDYDKALISEGGGVYSRALKSVPISPQARSRARRQATWAPEDYAAAVDTARQAIVAAAVIAAMIIRYGRSHCGRWSRCRCRRWSRGRRG